jgi:tetratricopeptide (TPR) repeat protein
MKGAALPGMPRTRAETFAGRWLPIALLIGIGVLLYGYTLPFPFIFDDHIYLLNNPLVQDSHSFGYLADFHTFANRAKRLGLDPDLSTNFILRPFAYLTFHLNYLAGGWSPPGFRVVNIAIHCANAVLLYALLLRLLHQARHSLADAGSADFIALGAALLFLVHPLQIESVTYVIQRFTSFGTFFYLATVLLFVAARTTADEKTARHCRRWSIAALLVGMLTKEFIFTAPFMMVLLDWLVLGSPLRESGRRMIPWFLCLPLIPVLIVFTAAAQQDGASFTNALNVAGPLDKGADFSTHYALSQPGVILTYLRLIFLPRGLNIDPDYPLATSLLSGRVIGPLAAIAILIAGTAWWYLRRSEDPRRALGFCAVLWFFVALSIDSSVVPLPDLMSEHRSYLPSIGALTAAVCLVDLLRTRLRSRPQWSWLVPLGLGAWIVALVGATVHRHEAWSSNVAIWEDTVTKSPNKARPWVNLGTALHDAGQWTRAAECYRRGLRINPHYNPAYFNLANTENTAGRFREALETAEAGLRINPNSHMLYYAHANACLRLGDQRQGLESLQAAIRLRPDHVQSQIGLASVYGHLGDYAQAIKHCQIARALGPLGAGDRQWLETIEDEITRRRLAR